MSRGVAERISGRTAKWVILVVWLAILVFSGVVGSQLTDAQNNETSSWLPGDAESTLAIEQLSAFQSQDALTAAIVYERAGG